MAGGRRRLAVLAFVVVIAAGVPVYRGVVMPPRALAPLCRAFASATAGALDRAGIAVERQDAVLRHPGGFAIEVTGNCTAWFHAVVYLAGLLVLRVQVPPGRATGVAACVGGLAVLAVANLLRLVLLFAVGARWPGAFEGMHQFAGEGLLAGAVLLLWRGVDLHLARAPREVAHEHDEEDEERGEEQILEPLGLEDVDVAIGFHETSLRF